MVERTQFPSHHDTRYFSPESYRLIVERALGLGYRIIPFREFEDVAEKPVLILRHDLDHTFQYVQQFAELESSLHVKSTYFVQTACEFYNLLAPPGRRLLTRLVELGHEVGLHYESERYTGEQGRQALEADIRLLEDLCGVPVVSAAQHLPSDGKPVDLLQFVQNEAYEPRFIEPPMTYVSDSLMVWRQVTPHDLLDQRRSFQFLTHPETWGKSFGNMFDALTDIKRSEADALERRYDDLLSYYAVLLEERSERDRLFRRRRSLAPRK